MHQQVCGTRWHHLPVLHDWAAKLQTGACKQEGDEPASIRSMMAARRVAHTVTETWFLFLQALPQKGASMNLMSSMAPRLVKEVRFASLATCGANLCRRHW